MNSGREGRGPGARTVTVHRTHPFRCRPAVAVICTLCVLGLVAAACGSPPTAAPTGPRSIVQLGDSVASGEGTLYGYTYDPATQRWTGGDLDAVWPGPYPLCHDSPDAYGHVLAARYHARFAQFACTGSTFTNGITGPRTFAGITYRPAQFGNLTTHTNINAAYDAARPDLVLVTLGADDVRFSTVVRACVTDQLAHALDPSTPLDCTAADPGATVQTDALGNLPTLISNLRTLARWISQRGAADHHVPKVVFTNYFDPFPTGSTSCPDSALLAPTQVSYLSNLLLRLNGDIMGTIAGLHLANVGVVDLSSAFDGHRWCSSDPWDYGLSIISLSNPISLLSPAPFHPTPRGQQQIASRVGPAVNRLFGPS
ncbi:MAG TPA: SGNH/GDSL hydrolase family protein, partial [Acidimicrobiales bacterium]|nr:SGNH/GDSL hydrolase family protein [Acidimicrobiales bacterium]